MKKVIGSMLFLMFCLGVKSQITLDYCQQKAREHYPLIANFDLIEQSKAYNIFNATRNYLPQISLNARATLQSEVVTLPFELPNMPLPELTKDQYAVTLDLTQSIWDGGTIAATNKSIKAQYQIDRDNLETNLYALRERISGLYFGILLLNEQLILANLMEEELNRNLKKVEACIQNGVANKADLNLVKVALLHNQQKMEELQANSEAYCKILSAFIGESITSGTPLEMPLELNNQTDFSTNLENRPEIKLFDSQIILFETNKKMLLAKNMPKIGLFAQGGYGRPGLNMLSNEFSFFAIGGVQLKWNFGSLYSFSNEKKQIFNAQQTVQTQKATFIFNNNLQLSQQKADIDRLQKQLNLDDEIIGLKTEIKQSTESKLEDGTATVNDLMKDVTEENVAKQNKLLRQIQLLMTIYNYNNVINK
ncbi:MAG: TolC family protein [Lentimicrobiaceae bacterium]|nr:TolC family protein [Lentimicrobiaceae bacterium]